MEKGEWIAIQSVIDDDIHIICSNCKEEFIGKIEIAPKNKTEF